MAASKKAPVLRKQKREKIEANIESGPEVDQRRDDIMRRMLATPPKPHRKMKVGKISAQEALETKCSAIYAEVREFFDSFCRKPDYGFKPLNSPPIYKPPFLFIGYQPGGSAKDFESETARGMHLRWPPQSEYAVGPWPLSRIMRTMFGRDMLERSMGMNAIFLRYPNVREYEENIDRPTRGPRRSSQ
jgi:hypothetical protein